MLRYFSIRLPPLELHIRILNSPCLILFTHTKHKTFKWDLGLTLHLHFLEGGELTHWVDKAKNVLLIVRQFPIKTRWWDAPLELPALAEAINRTIFSSNTVVTFIVFSKNFSNLLFTSPRRFKNSYLLLQWVYFTTEQYFAIELYFTIEQ